MSSDDDTHLRFQVADPGFSQEEEAIYQQSMAQLQEGMAQGMAWDKVVERLVVTDEVFKRLIVDDYLKITLANRHFQGGEGLKAIAKATRLPMDSLVRAKEEMIQEVSEASERAYHLTQAKGKSDPH